jgi:Xaa-Pro aminopeptidase
MLNAKQRFQNEGQIAASFHYHCMMSGASGLAYDSIVAAGANACVLHYTKNNAPINTSDCILIDAGCEVKHYCADVTRTWPVSGRFSSEQRVVYELVLSVQKEMVKRCRPGVAMQNLQKQSRQQLIEGLIQLGIVDGGADMNALNHEFYGHGVGHSLGLDVHDLSPKKEDFILEEDMVVTIEPGLYLSASPLLKDGRFENIGIRIEDNIHITKTGSKNLTAVAAVEPEEIEGMSEG